MPPIYAQKINANGKTHIKQHYGYSGNRYSQRYSDKSARDIKNLCILSENSAEDLGPRREYCLVTYLSVRMHPKSCHISPLKVETTLLGGSRKGTFGAELRSHS